ncbi:hypothetical protein Tco_0982105, partial [Tanacetum coccineum]
EILKMYPAPPPQVAPAKVNPSSQASKVTPPVTHSDKNPDPSHPPDSSKSAPTRG